MVRPMSERQLISLKDLPLCLRVGVPEAERAAPQVLRVDITLEICDPPVFFQRDELAQTIDYDAILLFLRDGLAAQGPFALIESIADRICAFCLALGAAVHAVDVRVSKPSVLPAEHGLVSVGLRRTRAGPLAVLANPDARFAPALRRAAQP